MFSVLPTLKLPRWVRSEAPRRGSHWDVLFKPMCLMKPKPICNIFSDIFPTALVCSRFNSASTNTIDTVVMQSVDDAKPKGAVMLLLCSDCIK